MIEKTDLVLLLTEIGDKQGIDVSKKIEEVFNTPTISLDILAFINKNRQIDVNKFFNKCRESYNNKKSKLYINIMKELSEDNIQDVLTTLSSYLLQANLFSKNVKDKRMFFKHARVEEVTRVLNNYYKTLDIENCIKVLRVIKCDISAFNHMEK